MEKVITCVACKTTNIHPLWEVVAAYGAFARCHQCQTILYTKVTPDAHSTGAHRTMAGSQPTQHPSGDSGDVPFDDPDAC